MSECELGCPPSGHVTTLVNNLHYFCCRKYSPSTESAGRLGGGGGGDYPGQEIVSICIIKIKIASEMPVPHSLGK